MPSLILDLGTSSGATAAADTVLSLDVGESVPTGGVLCVLIAADGAGLAAPLGATVNVTGHAPVSFPLVFWDAGGTTDPGLQVGGYLIPVTTALGNGDSVTVTLPTDGSPRVRFVSVRAYGDTGFDGD